MMPEHALAMIQPWHPAMMYLIYCAVSEEDMLEHRVENQPVPAGRLDLRLVPREALVEVHVTLCIYTRIHAICFSSRGGAAPEEPALHADRVLGFADPFGCVP